jgi:hypothetical protein
LAEAILERRKKQQRVWRDGAVGVAADERREERPRGEANVLFGTRGI